MRPAKVDDMLGTPFVVGGREPGRALDCLGVVVLVARRNGLQTEEPIDAVCQAIEHGGGDIREEMFPTGWRPIKPAAFGQLCDVAVMIDSVTQTDSHVAIVSEPGYVIHALRGVGVLRHEIGLVRRRILRAYRWFGEVTACAST